MTIDNNHAPIDVDSEAMSSLIVQGLRTLGTDWFARRLKREQLDREAVNLRDHRRQRIRHVAAHRIVQWFVEYDAWRQAYSVDSGAPLNQSALLITTFCSNLHKVSQCAGIDSIIRRLRIPAEFLAASFEVEVATGYLNRSWSVEFVETGNDRSPDLKVTTNDGNIFWAECKCREELTQRDQQVSAFCEELKNALHRMWGPARTNIGILLKATTDPLRIELGSLRDAILIAAEKLTAHHERARMKVTGAGYERKYEFELFFLAEPDQEIPFTGFTDFGGDSFEAGGEILNNAKGTWIRNPRFFGFTNQDPPDKYIGTLNAFKSAVGQLPESGPGVIWIRVPHPVNDARAQTELEQMVNKLKGELSGRHNTRVNCVVLSSRVFSNEPNQGREALTFRHRSALIMHENPRTPLSL